MDVDDCLKLWRETLFTKKRKDITPDELSQLFVKEEFQRAFFRLIDKDLNGSLCLTEWTGCFTKLMGNLDGQEIEWFIEEFYQFCDTEEKIYLTFEDFGKIASTIEFSYKICSLISKGSRNISCVKLMTSFEVIASMSSDSKWLSWLQYSFNEVLTKSNRLNNMEMYVTLEDFQENFYFKDPLLAIRIFAYLDKDKSGTLTLHEFINGLEVVVNGSKEAKMEFLFKAFDVDNNGRLDFNELRMMLRCCLEESRFYSNEEVVEDLASLLFREIDCDESGDISLDELKEAFNHNEPLYKTLAVCTSVWIKPKYIKKSSHSGVSKIRDFLINKRALFIFWSIYSLITILCTISAWYDYREENIYIIFARVFGNNLNFNCSLILVLVLRKHFTWFRIQGGAKYFPIDDFIEIHKKIGITILLQTLVHTIFHLIALYNKCTGPKKCNYWNALFVGYIPDDKIKIGYPTGVFLIILLFIICLFSASFIRKNGLFNVFHWFHMLTIPFLIVMLSHGLHFWKWILLPGILYAVEKTLSYKKTRSNKFGHTIITEAYVLPSKVVYLVIRKPPKFRFKPGDYIYLNIPSIAKSEWHPFSISSAPERTDDIWLHIRAIGNWTNKLYAYSKSSRFDMNTTTNNSQIDHSRYRNSMRSKMSNVLNEEYNFIPRFKNRKKSVPVEDSQKPKSQVNFQSDLHLNEQEMVELNKIEEVPKENINLAEQYFNKDKDEKVSKSGINDDNFTVVISDPSDSNAKKNAKNDNTIEEKHKDELGYLKMYKKANRVNINTIGEDAWRLRVFIDGPYGTPSNRILDAEHAVLIAAGIGITPFASILQSLMFRYRQARAKCPNCVSKISDHFVSEDQKLSVRKVDFIWITREQRSLEWFISLLSQIEMDQFKSGEEFFLETHLYVTSARRQSDLRTIDMHLTLDAIFCEEKANAVNGLRQRTHCGRPNWDIVLQSLIRKQKGKISAFYCGPPSLASTLAQKCSEYNLEFIKEIF